MLLPRRCRRFAAPDAGVAAFASVMPRCWRWRCPRRRAATLMLMAASADITDYFSRCFSPADADIAVGEAFFSCFQLFTTHAARRFDCLAPPTLR